MKDHEYLIAGGLVIAAIVVLVASKCFGSCEAIGVQMDTFLKGFGGGLTDSEEQEQASMYGHYY